ncbi:MAG: dehydrogenase [Chloroflexota bacterium]|nr:dehydrogenase [Chloroflexota bacterium]
MREPFRVGVTRDFLKPDGTIGLGDVGLGLLDDAAGVAWEFLAEDAPALRADQVRGYDALIVLGPKVTAETVADADRLAIVARFGVGYDSVDVEACTHGGVLVTNTPDGVRRPMATAILTFLLALTHRLVEKDRLTRSGRWGDKLDYMGRGLTGRVLGSIGLGNIGRELFRLAAPLEMRHLAHDPYVEPQDAAALAVELVDLETLLATSDFVVVNCALTSETRRLLDARRLALMKPSAFLVNAARGPIVDQAALTSALRERRIAGAALDVFEEEPVDPNDPLLALENVVVAPHSLCWTDEWALLTGRSACGAVLDVAAGRVPRYVVNREAIETETVKARLARLSGQGVG